MTFSFGKKYKLCRQQIIDSVFASGDTLKEYPFVLKYKITSVPENVPFQIAISAPKRSFRKAHDRNKIKRLTREAIRLTKNDLELYLDQNKLQIAIFLIYSAREEVNVQILQKKAAKLFMKLKKKLDENEK